MRRACTAGALGLAAALSLLVAHASARHSTRAPQHIAPGAEVRTRVPGPQPVPHLAGTPPAPQPPAQPPAADAAPTPTPAPPAAVSGGS